MGALTATMADEQKFTDWDEVPLVLSSEQVANILGVHRNTVKALYDEGLLKGFKVGRLLKFNRSDVKRYLGLTED